MSDTLPACFSEMFPTLDNLQYNKACSGALFSVQVSSSGVGPQGRQFSMIPGKLKVCMDCPRYRCCYDLSMGKLALQFAVSARF